MLSAVTSAAVFAIGACCTAGATLSTAAATLSTAPATLSTAPATLSTTGATLSIASAIFCSTKSAKATSRVLPDSGPNVVMVFKNFSASSSCVIFGLAARVSAENTSHKSAYIVSAAPPISTTPFFDSTHASRTSLVRFSSLALCNARSTGLGSLTFRIAS